MIQMKPVLQNELSLLSSLAQNLWPHHTQEELCAEFAEYLASGAIFAAWEKENMIGFAQCSLRHDYVEGCSESPVGYLEGIFVLEDYRRQGISRRLLSACEEWAGKQGCREFASDCELDNSRSLTFHLACGFEEANRIICFRKTL